MLQVIDMTAFNTDGFDVSGKNVWIHDCQIWNQVFQTPIIIFITTNARLPFYSNLELCLNIYDHYLVYQKDV